MNKELFEMTDNELSALYVEKTESLATGLRALERMETGYGRNAVIRELGALENEIGYVAAEIEKRENPDEQTKSTFCEL